MVCSKNAEPRREWIGVPHRLKEGTSANKDARPRTNLTSVGEENENKNGSTELSSKHRRNKPETQKMQENQHKTFFKTNHKAKETTFCTVNPTNKIQNSTNNKTKSTHKQQSKAAQTAKTTNNPTKTDTQFKKLHKGV